MRKIQWQWLMPAVLIGWSLVAWAVSRIEALALMADAAVLAIDGHQRTMRAGQRSPEGVLLVRADSRSAVIEVNGQRRELTLSQRIAGNFEDKAQTEVRVESNNRHEYLTLGEINGYRTEVLIDTGANIVALNSGHAAAMGIDYRKIGTPAKVSTAGGVKTGYSVLLDKVSVGGIEANYVRAIVIEGDFPEQVLLGMSYLQHVGLREENGVMYLRQKY